MRNTTCATTVEEKRILRQRYRNLRQCLSSQQRQQASRLLAKHCSNHTLLKAAQRIAFYMASDGEIDPCEVMQWAWKQGKRCYLPLIQPDKTLRFAQFSVNDELMEGEFGILVPKEPDEVLTAQALDVICLPLVAFDEDKQRLGMGGGFYDRTLSVEYETRSPVLLGLAFECQRCDRLPKEPWDRALDAVITPNRTW